MADIPVALFAYNRVKKLERVLESLRRNSVSKLYVFSDGPRGYQDQRQIQEVRKMVRSIAWITPEVVERPVNLGVKLSMIMGLEHVFSREDRVIVVEDDVSVSPDFCDFMAACLEKYENDETIAGVTGLRYPFRNEAFADYRYDVFFAPRFSSWGWGTWKRWWSQVDFNNDRVREWIRNCTDEDLEVAGPDIPETARFLERNGEDWGATTADVYSLLYMMKKRNLFVWPVWNMVENLGFSEGTHASNAKPGWGLSWEQKPAHFEEGLRFPETVQVHSAIWSSFCSFLHEAVENKADQNPPRKRTRHIARFLLKEMTPPFLARVIKR